MTLVSSDEEYRRAVEPGAAPYAQRLEVLRALHEDGCATWVSMEPYPTPNLIEQKLSEVLNAVDFADKIIFGRTNYSRDVSAYPAHKEFYNDCAATVIEFCEARNIAYHIKQGTQT